MVQSIAKEFRLSNRNIPASYNHDRLFDIIPNSPLSCAKSHITEISSELKCYSSRIVHPSYQKISTERFLFTKNRFVHSGYELKHQVTNHTRRYWIPLENFHTVLRSIELCTSHIMKTRRVAPVTCKRLSIILQNTSTKRWRFWITKERSSAVLSLIVRNNLCSWKETSCSAWKSGWS